MRHLGSSLPLICVVLLLGLLASCAPSSTPTATAVPPTPTAVEAPAMAASPTSASAPAVQAPASGEVTGADLYQLSCAPCHGQDRSGNTFDVDGQTISVPELSWSDLNQMYQTQPSRGDVPKQLELAITQGLDEEGDDLEPMMPRWSSFSQAQVDSLINYLQMPDSTAGAVPTLTAEGASLQGEQLFQTACAACHGADGAGKSLEADDNTISTPSLHWGELTQMYSTDPSRGTIAEQVSLAITQGKDEEGDDLEPMMPRWSFLTQGQVDSLVEYIQTTFK